MKPAQNSARVRLKLIRTAALLIWVVMPLLPSVTRGQQSAEPKRVLVLYWYNKDFPGNVIFDRSFQAALQSAPTGNVEYYPEYLESNRFPGENQSLSLRDYLREKYANHPIDVVVANTDIALDFLFKYRNDLFPHTPIVFLATKRPTTNELEAGPGLTGIMFMNTHRKTLDLALSLHPGTEHVFIISGTLEHDKKFETLAREELQGYESRVLITYLTDFPPDELIQEMKRLPQRSIVLYVWQQSQNQQGKVLETQDVLAIVARSATVPIYGMSGNNVGKGIIGGCVSTIEARATRTAEIALQVANGTRAKDIPVESAPTVPMFDWRELRRWGISEDHLPVGSVVQFRELSFWGLYRWQIIGVISLCLIEAFLIFALLAQRSRRELAEEGLRLSEEKFSKAFRGSPDALAIIRRSDRIILEVNDHWTTLSGYSRDEATVRTTLDLGLYVTPEDQRKFFRIVEEQGFVHDFESDFRSNPGDLLRVILSAEPITIDNEPCLLTIIRDITERKQAEEALHKSEDALRESYTRVEDLAGRLLVAQEEERKYIARELHDDLNQQVAALAIGLGMLGRQLPESNNPVRSQLMKLEDRTTQLSEGIRRLSRELHSSTLEHVGLAEALKLHCSEFIEQQGIAVSFNLDGGIEPLPPDVALCLYRVAQESLRNIAKHSGAKSAELTLVKNEESIELRIADHGRGFDVKEPSRGEGLGLVSMEERVRLLGGSLEVYSQPGAGTQLKVYVHVRSGQ